MAVKVRRLYLGMSVGALLAGTLVSCLLSSTTNLGGSEAQAASAAGYSEADLRALETREEAKIRELREQEITQLRIALGRRSPANRQADLYFRLAEIYLEGYRATYLLEGRVHEKRLESGRPEKLIDHTQSRPYLAKGIAACREIIKFRIRYPKMDQVYFFLGFNYGELGDQKESLRYFEQLTREFPGSGFAAEAYQQMGDVAFGAGQFRKAQGYFESAVQAGSRQGGAAADSVPRIQHKLAWAYYRTKQYDRAVETMKQAVAGAKKSDERFLSLREEALRDMAIFLTETGRVEEAISYFQSVANDKSFYPKLLEKLGRQYERGVEPAKATQVYESLLKTHPESDAAFRVLVKLVDLDLRRGKYKEALGRLKDARLERGNDPESQVAWQNLRAMIRRTATEHHEKFRKNADRGALEIAESYYQAYLGSFLAKEDARGETPEIQMYLAEVKRDLGKSKEASALYRKVVDSRDKRYAKEAGALWTASLAEAIQKEHSAKSASAAPVALEPSEMEKEYISAADSLQEALGETPEGREAALKAAEVLAGYKNTQKDAIKRIRRMIERWPRTVQSVTAARLWVQLAADRLTESPDAVDDMKDVLKELRENAALQTADQELGKGKLKTAMGEQDMRLRVVAIAAEEKDKNFAAAAKGYEAFARDSAQRDLAEKAYANAITSYLKIGDDESVERVTQAWLKRFPKSPKAVESTRATATQMLIGGKFDRAGRLFERIGTDGGDAEALETAARVYEGNGDGAKAQAARTTYLELYKGASARPLVLLQLAKVKDQAQQESEASRLYRECMAAGQPDLEAECGARLADLYLRAKNTAEAKVLYKKVGALSSGGKRKLESGAAFVGYARYMLAHLLEQEARFEPLQLPEAKLKAAMNQRTEFLESLSRAYTSAVEAGGPWAISALDRLANWVLQFAEEVDHIPAPAGADPAAVAQFRKSLASVSGPLRKRATQVWQEAYSKCLAAEALSPALPQIVDQLAEAKAGGVGRAQGYPGRFRLAGIPADSGAAALEKTRERLGKSAQDASAWVDYGNLLWGAGKPLLAAIAYDRAIALNPKNPAALNNRGVVELSPAGAEQDWLVAAQAAERFRAALTVDDFFVPAKFNRAALLNYYRLFAKAKPLWEQVLVKAAGADAQEGLAIALQGLGDTTAAEATFRKAEELGANAKGFSYAYHEAARLQSSGSAEKCLGRLADAESSAVSGFEKEAMERLKRACKDGIRH